MYAHSGQTIQVMLVDDHAMVRAGLKALLEQTQDIQVVGEAANGFQAIELVKQIQPDVILMDLSMPGMDGIEAIQRILAIRPGQHILVLTGFLDEERLIQAIQAGAQGCVDKTIPPEDLVQAIRDVSLGKPAINSGLAWHILREMNGNEIRQQKNKLSEREIEVAAADDPGKAGRGNCPGIGADGGDRTHTYQPDIIQIRPGKQSPGSAIRSPLGTSFHL